MVRKWNRHNTQWYCQYTIGMARVEIVFTQNGIFYSLLSRKKSVVCVCVSQSMCCLQTHYRLWMTDASLKWSIWKAAFVVQNGYRPRQCCTKWSRKLYIHFCPRFFRCLHKLWDGIREEERSDTPSSSSAIIISAKMTNGMHNIHWPRQRFLF